MPNAGDREAYIASKVKDASNHSKALLLAAIGSASATPSESTKAAEALGLSNEEVRYARWVALFKKGRTRADFFAGLLGTLTTEKETASDRGEELKMARTPIEKGSGYYADKLFQLLHKVFGVERSDVAILNSRDPIAYEYGGYVRVHLSEVGLSLAIKFATISDHGFADRVELRVQRAEAMSKARRLKKSLEAFTKRAQEKPTEFVLVQDFA